MIPHGALKVSNGSTIPIDLSVQVQNVIANCALHGVDSDLDTVKRG